MLNKIIPFLIITLLFFSCKNQQQEKQTNGGKEIDNIKKEEAPNTAELTLKSTVAITMQDKNRQTFALGSGVVVGKGLVITNLHVIAGASFGYVQLTSNDQKHYIEGFLAIDKINDLALLSIPTIQTSGLILQNELPKVGEKIFAAGNPQGLSGTFSDGIVSSLRQFEKKELIQITAPISPGSSGGPIVNDKAELLGIAVGGFTDGQNLNFAIPSKFIDALFKNQKELISLNTPKNKKYADAQQSSSKKVQTDLREVVKIRNLKWESDHWDAVFQTQFHWPKPNTLTELTILNNLNYPISNIKIFFIMYDNTGTPVDYNAIEILPKGSGTILPGLAKSFGSPNRVLVSIDKKWKYKCEVRLLDFKINYDN
jgi:hypothetical protein